jgi:hypothetical protein
MAPRSPRKTVAELYGERQQTAWHWRVLGVAAAAMILTGWATPPPPARDRTALTIASFLVFPIAFGSPGATSTPGTASVAAVVLLALGYSLSVALWFACTSVLFQLDVIFVPCLFSCALGFVNVAIALRTASPPASWTTASISAVSLACASSLIYASLSILTFVKMVRVRSEAERRPDSESTMLLPEGELQRQQLLRLLLQKESDKASPQTAQATFRIDIPDTAKLSHRPSAPDLAAAAPLATHLAAPSHVYESRGRSIAALAIDDQFALLRGQVAEPPMDRRQAALERARARSQQQQQQQAAYAAARPGLSRESSGSRPPIIVNTRALAGPEVPIEELHPLERSPFIRGTQAPKDDYSAQRVYRAELHDDTADDAADDDDLADDPANFSYSNPSPERARAEIELEDRGRRATTPRQAPERRWG